MKTKRECGTAMLQWHGSQGDPIYAVGSYLISDIDYPNLEVVSRAVEGIQNLQKTTNQLVDSGDIVGLREIEEFLKAYIDERTPQGSEEGSES